MKVAGIIAEYNPFHAGHKYHIEETRRITGADRIIVVMSGDFVQRGEPAIVDKYLRTRMALEGGADLVLEMPTLYATASAEYFATAGVGILDSIGCVDYLSFGSEWADPAALEDIAEVLMEEPAEFRDRLMLCMESGMNYPKARQEALKLCLPEERYHRILESPNDILGIEYMKALKRRKSSIEPVVIRREGSGYLEDSWKQKEKIYPSATALRKILREKKEEDVERLRSGIPCCLEELLAELEAQNTVTWEDLMPILDYNVLFKNHVLGKYFGMDYDLSQRIVKTYQPGLSFEEIIERCHSRNHTDASLRRVFLHLILHFKEQKFLQNGSGIPIPYIRVLGFRKTAGSLISRMREAEDLPIIQKVTDGKKLSKVSLTAKTVFDLDLRSANLYEQIAARKSGRPYRIEYIRNPVIL